MNIHEAAKKIREFGIPGDEKERAIRAGLVRKDSANVRKAVEKYIEKMLVRWAYTDEIITKPKQNTDGKGKGKTSEWPATVVEEAAAVWGVRHSGLAARNTLTAEFIFSIKKAAERAYTSPNAIHMLPSNVEITTPNPSDIYDFHQLETRLVKHERFNQLLITWIAVSAKVRNNDEGQQDAERVKKIEKAHPESQKTERTMKELGAVSCPRYNFFKIRDPVRAVIHWRSELVRVRNPLLKDVHEDEFDRTLEKEGLLLSPDELSDFDLFRMPVKFRNVPNWLLTQECRIPPTSPTLREFWSRIYNLPEDATNDDIDSLRNEITKDWRYVPAGWKFKFTRVEVEPTSKERAELIILLDGNDSRQKALYAPFNEYSPYETYAPKHKGRIQSQDDNYQWR